MKYGKLNDVVFLDRIDGRCAAYPKYTHRIRLRNPYQNYDFRQWLNQNFGEPGPYRSAIRWRKKVGPEPTERYLWHMDTSWKWYYFITEEDATYVTLFWKNNMEGLR